MLLLTPWTPPLSELQVPTAPSSWNVLCGLLILLLNVICLFKNYTPTSTTYAHRVNRTRQSLCVHPPSLSEDDAMPTSSQLKIFWIHSMLEVFPSCASKVGTCDCVWVLNEATVGCAFIISLQFGSNVCNCVISLCLMCLFLNSNWLKCFGQQEKWHMNTVWEHSNKSMRMHARVCVCVSVCVRIEGSSSTFLQECVCDRSTMIS